MLFITSQNPTDELFLAKQAVADLRFYIVLVFL